MPNPKNPHVLYAAKYNCTIAEAICDRDWPMTEAECVEAFTEAAGRQPTETEVAVMRPDTSESVDRVNGEDWSCHDMYR